MAKKKYIVLPPVAEQELRKAVQNSTEATADPDPLVAFSAAIHQFQKFVIGPSFWFIADLKKWKTVACGGSIHQIHELTEKELLQSPQALFQKTYPDDLKKIFSFSKYWTDYYKLLPPAQKAGNKASIFVRMMAPDKQYNWFMVQYADQIQDKAGEILYILTIVTNVHHIKKDNLVTMNIIDSSQEVCHQFISVQDTWFPNPYKETVQLTSREIEVLRLIAQGHGSKQMASILNISPKTIDNHRQKMLQKTSAKSSGELVAFGISMGLI